MNIVLINCDDMGYGDLGCYGSKLNRTPFIDSLAKEGTIFTSCYAGSPVCSPSRASMLTGCYPAKTGINSVLMPGEGIGLSCQKYSIGKLFKDNGYKTMIVGKWHCGDQEEFLPLRFGFDDYYGLPYSNDMGRQIGRENDSKHPPLPLMRGNDVIEEQPDQCSLTERYVEKCVEFIRANKENPFFLYFAQMHVHLPLYANKRFENESENGDYGACVSEVDWACHCIVDELKRLGIYENTCIIFTSDNGSRGDHGGSNGILRGGKHTTWEGGFRIPCLFHWKGVIPEGVKSDKIIAQIDFLPLFAHMIGGKLPDGINIDGLDIYDTVFSNRQVRDEYVYFGQNASRDKGQTGYLCAVRKGNWKLHMLRKMSIKLENGKAKQFYGEVRELYNLKDDIEEKNNVYENYPEIAQMMMKLYEDYSKKYGNQGKGIIGTETESCAEVLNPKTLTVYDENHPYIVALYDKSDRG